MKKLFFILFFLIFAIGFGQKGGNLFENAESKNVYSDASMMNVTEDDSLDLPPDITAPPGDDDLPIDDYIPLLVLTAIGLIMSIRYREKQTL